VARFLRSISLQALDETSARDVPGGYLAVDFPEKRHAQLAARAENPCSYPDLDNAEFIPLPPDPAAPANPMS